MTDDPHAIDYEDRAEDLALQTRLTERQAAVFVLYFERDLPEATVTEILDCATGTLRSHAGRVRAKVRGARQLADVAEDVELGGGSP